MKRKYLQQLFFAFLILYNFPLQAQEIKISTGAIFSLGNAVLTLPGNYINHGRLISGTGTITFNGSSAVQSISSDGVDSFYNIKVNKTANEVQLLNNIALSGTFTTISGGVDLNGNNIHLAENSYISEAALNTIKGSGEISGTLDMNAPSGINAFNLGASITSDANLGTTIIKRGHAVQSGSTNTSIKRYYDIIPANNSGLNAILVFSYDESELNGINENDLRLFKSTDAGTTWVLADGRLNTAANLVVLTGINDFSRWTLGDVNAPLPVELSSFKASIVKNSAILEWQTENEINNYGFEVERLTSASWTKTGFVKGNGNSNNKHNYFFADELKYMSGKISYRLKQIDNDGGSKYSDIVSVDAEAPKEFTLYQNYPNPFNPETKIKFTVPENRIVVLKIFDPIGKEIATLYNGMAEAGNFYEVNFDGSNLTSGFYIAQLSSGDTRLIKKMLLLK